MNVKMKLSNLNRQEDVNALRAAFENFEGVLAVEVMLDEKIVDVTYDDFYTTQYVIMDIVEELGYGIVNISGKLK